MSDFDDRYDPNSMDNYMDDLYYDEHYGSSGSGHSNSYSFTSLGAILLYLLGIPVLIIGLMIMVAVPPLGVLIILGAYALMGK